MWLMNVYRGRGGDYILVPHPKKYSGSDAGLYLGVVAGTSLGAEICTKIALQLTEHPCARLTPTQFFYGQPRDMVG
ncbi:hypothetical protein LYSHEL_27700 [Lysobacter helvus]|uniref:Uncharacterized protein n=2 Tax=Lysobacteraceae TaxID=32033 RepID=A0ABM7Q8I6_9GAMM|nr:MULTISPECIES: hypothetical protein [Lysobacter]BCT93743.1 hypothetical protein LYSCAS_27670 [Lysobacter caseinilyticus]BCT96899.1 hypothetical protein LYSHEL_27700 [Lysobacter helvus]